MKRKKANFKKIVILLIFCILIASFAAYKIIQRNNAIEAERKRQEAIRIEANKPKITSLSMVMVGDSLIHANVYNDAKVGDTYNFEPMFTNVSSFIKSHDLAFYNQETPFGGKAIGYGGYPKFNTPSEIGDTLLSMGFNLVSLATNHTMDRGEIGVTNSLAYWNSKDVIAAGSYLSEADRIKDNIKEKNKIKYTMLAYATRTNYGTIKPYYLDMYEKEKVAEDIKRVRDKVDLLIVSIHWGEEYALTPSSQQKEIAAYLSSLGVDIIIGTHTHSVQPIQYIGKTVVFYSLGNFISSQLNDDDLIGLMPTLKITKTVVKKKTTIAISDVKARLIFTYYKGGRVLSSVHKNHKVIPFDQLTATDFPPYKTYYAKYKKLLTSMEPSIYVEPIKE